jgi:transcriptional regulator with XRE-family HTH domain
MMMRNIRELRKRTGLPVDGFAQIAGVSQRTITLWEKYGLVPRNRNTIEKIARVLGMSADELLEITATENGSSVNGSADGGVSEV